MLRAKATSKQVNIAHLFSVIVAVTKVIACRYLDPTSQLAFPGSPPACQVSSVNCRVSRGAFRVPCWVAYLSSLGVSSVRSSDTAHRLRKSQPIHVPCPACLLASPYRVCNMHTSVRAGLAVDMSVWHLSALSCLQNAMHKPACWLLRCWLFGTYDATGPPYRVCNMHSVTVPVPYRYCTGWRASLPCLVHICTALPYSSPCPCPALRHTRSSASLACLLASENEEYLALYLHCMNVFLSAPVASAATAAAAAKRACCVECGSCVRAI